MNIKVLLADDHTVVRKGLQLFLSTYDGIEIVGEACNGEEVLQLYEEKRPDIILMDIRMPKMDGIETTRRLAASYPEAKVIVMTSYNDQDHVLPALRSGAKGYLLKDVDPEELIKAVEKVHLGGVVLHPDATDLLVNYIAEPPDMNDQKDEAVHSRLTKPRKEASAAFLPDPLTQRESEVLRLIAQGKTNREIAENLVITEKTVKTHVSHILSKLALGDRTQAAVYAIKNGLDVI
ncbi:response regulator transcription factor [Neobacillus mesonae]|nr:response regulator transcription factor [Neobacillus mesonae]